MKLKCECICECRKTTYNPEGVCQDCLLDIEHYEEKQIKLIRYGSRRNM